MRRTLAILVASTALTAAVGFPALSALRAPANDEASPSAAVLDAEPPPLMLASGGNDDDRRWRRTSRDDDDDDDDDDDGGHTPSPAPAGTVAPPSNGLFGTGAPPQAQVN